MAKLLAILLLLVSIPTAVYLVTHPTIFKSRASQNGLVNLYQVDGSTVPNNNTRFRYIYLEIQKPDWSYGFSPSLIKDVYAQEIDTDVSDPVVSHDLGLETKPGTAFRVYWSNVSLNYIYPKKIGLYKFYANDDRYEDGQWLYISSCNQENDPNKTVVSGSCPATLPNDLALGTYQLRMFTEIDGQTKVIARSANFNVISPATPPTVTPTPLPYVSTPTPQSNSGGSSNGMLVISPNPIPNSQQYTVSWNNISNATSLDWIGLYRTIDGDDKYFFYFYTSSCGKDPDYKKSLPQGSCTFTAGASNGTFEYRLFRNNSYEKLSTFKFQVGNEVSSPSDASAYTQRIRISLNEASVNPNGDCDASIRYLDYGVTQIPIPNDSYCKEIDGTDSDLLKKVSWVLPDRSGDYTIYVGFISNKGGFRETSTRIHYEKPPEIPTSGVAFPAGLIAVQTFVGQVTNVLRTVPGTSVINGAIELISRVHESGEEIITVSQAKQVGLPIDIVTNAQGLPEISQDKNRILKIGLDIEYFPDPDPVTQEPRIVIYPAPVPLIEEEVSEVIIDTAVGETLGRTVAKIAKNAVNRYRGGKAGKAFNENTTVKTPNQAPKPIKVTDISDLIKSNNPEAIAIKLDATYLGEAGSFGWGFKSHVDGSFIKIYKQDPLAVDFYQKDFYKRYGGTGEIARFLGEVTDESGKLVGFKQEFLESVSFKEYTDAGLRFTKAEIEEAVNNFAATTRRIGHGHGDVVRFGPGWEHRTNTYLHPSNLRVQIIKGANGKATNKIKFIDWGGFDMTVKVSRFEDLVMSDAIKKSEFIESEIRVLRQNLLKYAY